MSFDFNSLVTDRTQADVEPGTTRESIRRRISTVSQRRWRSLPISFRSSGIVQQAIRG